MDPISLTATAPAAMSHEEQPSACEGLRIRGTAQRDTISNSSSDSVPSFLCPPARASDGDVAWGLGLESRDDVRPAWQDKIAELHALKAQGTHFNVALAKNRAFHNPRIHAKLVEWARLNEYGSNYSAIASAQGVAPSWDAANADVLRDGQISALGTLASLTQWPNKNGTPKSALRRREHIWTLCVARTTRAVYIERGAAFGAHSRGSVV